MVTREIFSLTTRLVFLAITVQCSTIHLKIKAYDICEDDQTRYILYEGDPFNLEVVGFNLEHAWCNKQDSAGFSSKIDVLDNTIKVQNVTKDMSTRWKCTLLRERSSSEYSKRYRYLRKNFTTAECIRTIHVRSKNLLHITTQGELMKMNVTDSSIMDYDAVAVYDYQEGEIVHTDCAHNQSIGGGLSIEYYNANKTLLFKSKPMYNNNKLIFRSYMTADRNGSYLDCKLNQTMSTDNFVYRIYYILKQRYKDSSIVLVNGLELVYNPNYNNYIYYYITGEQLELVCGARDNQRGSTNSDVIESHLSERYRGIDLSRRCGTSNNPIYITFTSDLKLERPRITGLQPPNILYEYTSSTNEWTIHYQHKTNETLNLSCVREIKGYPDFNLQWIYNGQTLYNCTPNTDRWYKTKSINSFFSLTDTYNETTIQCRVTDNISGHLKSAVILRLQKISEFNQGAKRTEDLQVDRESSRSSWWIIGGASAFVFLVTIALCALGIFWLRKKHPNTENDYCEISEQDNAPIPAFPSQWNEYIEHGSHYTNINDGVLMVNNYYHTRNRARQNEPSEVALYAEINATSGSGSRASTVYDYAYGFIKPAPIYCNSHSDIKGSHVYQNTFDS